MQTRLMTRLFVLWLLALLISPTVFGQGKSQKPKREHTEEELLLLSAKGKRPPSGPGFYIGPIEGSTHFSILVSDGNGRSVADSFTSHQLDVFEAVLQAAKAFAMSDEKVGVGTPITTRLIDEKERAFFVDVTKIGNRSRFYVSLHTVTGKVTTPAGEIIRDSKKEPSALFLTILSQVQQARASVNPQQ